MCIVAAGGRHEGTCVEEDASVLWLLTSGFLTGSELCTDDISAPQDKKHEVKAEGSTLYKDLCWNTGQGSLEKWLCLYVQAPSHLRNEHNISHRSMCHQVPYRTYHGLCLINNNEI
jgi:hypothetical protein